MIPVRRAEQPAPDPQPEHLSERLSIAVTPTEKAAVRQAADDADISMSAFGRRALKAALQAR